MKSNPKNIFSILMAPHTAQEEALEEQRKGAKDAKDAKAVARLVANSPEKIDFCGPPLEGPQKPTNDLHTLL